MRSPTSDIDQYLAVIDALDDEIRALVDQYISEERISANDRLLDEGVAILEGLSKPGRDILTWDDRHTTRSEWKGHHTRTANVWSDDLPLPILEPIPESRHRQEWELTGFGEFIVELYEHGIDRNEVDQNGFPLAVSDEVLERALKEEIEVDIEGQ